MAWYLSADKHELLNVPYMPETDEYTEITEEEATAWQNDGYVVPPPEPPPAYSNEVLTAAMLELTKDL